MAEHGTRQCYADGCRLPECKAAQAKYRREHKARQLGVVTDFPKAGRKPKTAAEAAVVAAQDAVPAGAGWNEQQVLAELATLSSAETRKGAAASAIALAKILDNPNAVTSWVSAAKALPDILKDLREGSARKKGRLASVQSLVKPSSATGTDA